MRPFLTEPSGDYVENDRLGKKYLITKMAVNTHHSPKDSAYLKANITIGKRTIHYSQGIHETNLWFTWIEKDNQTQNKLSKCKS